MRSPQPVAAVVLALAFAPSFASAPAPRAQTLSPPALDEALRIARARRPSEFEKSIAPYQVVRGGPGSPSVEVITEFRRAIMLARQQVELGNYTWSPKNLSDAIAKYEGLTSVRAEIWLSPVHLYVGTPAYRLDLYTATTRTVPPVEEKRDPIFAPTSTGEGTSMTGVTLETIYRDEVLREPGCCLLVLVDPHGEMVVRQHVPFGTLR